MDEETNKGMRNSPTRDDKSCGQSAQADPQTGSLLFSRLPQEVRDQIWVQLFCSTRFAFGKRPINQRLTVMVKPAPNGLALLRACRRARLEIGDSWLRHVLFCFEDVVTMLDKLSPLAVDTVSKIRHLRLSHTWISLRLPDDFEPDDDSEPDDDFEPGGAKTYYLAAVFKLLPGLHLDQLTIFGISDGYTNYRTFHSLAMDGSGWKTLRFIGYNPTTLGLPFDYEDASRAMRWTREWQAVVESRDGVTSNPSVTAYHVKDPVLPGSILDEKNRVGYGQKPPDGQELREEVLPEYPDPGPKSEVMILVKRGDGTDYQEKKGSPLIFSDIRRDFNGIDTWTEIRHRCPDVPDDESKDKDEDTNVDKDDGCLPGGVNPVEVDVYEDVDQYDWTPAQIYHPVEYP